MSTLSWLEILLFVGVVVGTLCFHLGRAIGKEQAEKDQIDRLRDQAIEACIASHPAGKQRPKLRIVKE
jgi:hypothetical protein